MQINGDNIKIKTNIGVTYSWLYGSKNKVCEGSIYIEVRLSLHKNTKLNGHALPPCYLHFLSRIVVKVNNLVKTSI